MIGLGLNVNSIYGGGSGFTGLLDGNSGAVAAYSLRKLSSTYTGPAITVTTNGSDSQDIGFAGENLDVNALLAFANGGQARVTKWYDQSGEGADIRQSTFVNTPIIVQSGSLITENGKPTVFFASASHWLSNNTGIDILGNQGWSSYFVMRQSGRQIASSSEKAFASFGQVGSGTCIRFTLEQPDTSSAGFAIRVNAGNSIHESDNISNDQLGLLAWNLQDGHLNWGDYATAMYNTGIEAKISAVASASVNYQKKYVGIGGGVGGSVAFSGSNAYPADFYMSEMILFGNETLGTRAQIETNINSHYTIY